MIFSIAIFGLVLLTLIILAKYNWKMAVAALIPLTYLGYYQAVTEVPKYFGYAVPLNFTELDQARFLGGTMNEKTISILIMEKDKTEPRLISIPNTEQNKKAFEQLQKTAKNGAAVLRKGGKKSDKQGEGGNATLNAHGDIESVPMKEQEIIRKDG
jgi:hypothetical protein